MTGPTAGLWPCEIDIQIGEWIFTVPDHPASVWIEAISNPEGGAIVPGLLGLADQRLIWKDFIAGRVTTEDLSTAWREALGAACGRPWWEGARLVLDAVRDDTWPVIHGRLIRSGIDLDRISLGAFWNAVYSMALESCKDEEAQTRFKWELSLPPADVQPEELPADTAANDFMAAMATLQQLRG